MKHLLKKNSLTIRGAGGGGGGAPAPPGPVAVQMYPAVLAPPLMGETSYISSFSYAEIVDLISDGPIEGLVNQDNKKVYGQDIFEGIFLNGVPVKETSRINTEELDISFLRKEIKDFWKINEGDGSQFLSKKNPYTKVITSTSSSLINNPFFSGPITITSYHPEDSLFQLINSLNLNLDSIKLAERAFDIISINNERPFLTVINIPTFTIPIADFKFDKSFFGLTDKTYGLDLEISNIGQYIYFTVDSENLNSNHYSEIPRTFIKYNGYSQPTTLKNNVPPLIGYSAQKFDNINIYIWSVYDEENGIKNISKALDRYFNKITVRQRLPGQYNYNLIKSEFKNGAEVQYPLQNFKNVEIDIQHDKELIGPFKIKNNQKVNSAKSCIGGGVRRLTNLVAVEEDFPITSNFDEESSDDVRYIANWPIEYNEIGTPLIIKGINFNYAVFDNNSKNRVEQPAIPVVHYVDNNNVEEVYVSLTLNNLSDTNHIDLVSQGFGTKPNYTETPYEGTLTYGQLINQNQITNPPTKVSERYIVGVNIYYFTPFSKIFPLGIRKNDNIDEAQYPFVKKFANEISTNAIQNNNTSYPEKIILFGINLDFLQSKNFITSETTITIENLNTLLGKYYLFKNSDFQTLLSNFDGGKLIGYSKIVDPTKPYEEFTIDQAKKNFPYRETITFNVFTSLEATTFGNGIYLNSIYKNTSTHDYVFKYKLTPKEVNTNLAVLPCRAATDVCVSPYNRRQQITAGTKLPSIVSVRIDTGYETNECSDYVSLSDFYSYNFDIYGLANDPSKIDLGRRGYSFVRGIRNAVNPKAGVYAVTKADSIVPFHLFKVTECGRPSNYYISNTRDFQFGDVNFSCLNTCCYFVKNELPEVTGEARVYYPMDENYTGDIECCFSGSFTGTYLSGSSGYFCEICILNENGMFGLQTSGYLSLEDFESEIILDGGLKIPETLKDSMFDDYKLNMSTALPELKKINYLNLSNFSAPYNFIECSRSLNPSINCYNIDTYKFNSAFNDTCVQICSFDLDIYNVFSENNEINNPKTSYSFSIFRVNGDVSTTQIALNQLGYKYVMLALGEVRNTYFLIYLPDGKNTDASVLQIIENITKNVKTTSVKTSLSCLCVAIGYEFAGSFVPIPSTCFYGQSDLTKVDNFIISNQGRRPATLYGSSNYLFTQAATVTNTSRYNIKYDGYCFSNGKGTTNNLSPSPANGGTCIIQCSLNSSLNLPAYSKQSELYYQSYLDQNDLNTVPALNDQKLKSFILSISNDQNVANINAIIQNFKRIIVIARSNIVALSTSRQKQYLFEANNARTCINPNTKKKELQILSCREISFNATEYAATICYRAEDNISRLYNLQPSQGLASQIGMEVGYYVKTEIPVFNLESEIGAGSVFTVSTMPRTEIASPVKGEAISINAKFWFLHNTTTDMIHIVFTDFTKEQNWKELEDNQAINLLPITKLLTSYEAVFDYEMFSRSRRYYGPASYSLNHFNIQRNYSHPYSYQNIANIRTYDASDGWPSNFNMIYNYFYNGMNHFLVGQVVPQGILRRMRAWIRQGGGRDPSGGRIDRDYYSYNFKTNHVLASETDASKNIRIIGAKRNPKITIAENITSLLKDKNFLGNNVIPIDSRIPGRGNPNAVFSLRWSHTDNFYSSNSQTLDIKYFEVPITNFSSKTQAIYADDAGEQILLPPPRLDLSGSPIRRYVKITKLSYETLSPLISKRISVGTVTEIIPQTFSYPFSAIVGTKIDARSFSQMPSRSFHCKLKKVLVPSNYYPNNPSDESDIRYDVTQVGLHKIYDGDWDGTFKLMWTDNPAWILMDMLVNKRYGLGNHIAPEQIDIWELYQVARWCDGVDDEGYYYGVPDSYGGVEPRHAFNALIGDKFNVFDMINQIASVFRGHVYYMNSLITFDDDRPKPPIGEFTNADVKDGLFNYTNMKKDDEFTVVEVAFVDAKNDYRSSIEYVENADAIRKRGILKKQMNAFGVTSRGQARRIGKHFLHQTSKENLNVSFTTDMRALLYKPGDLITVHDELLNSYKNFGSVKAIEEVPNSGDLFKIVIDQALNSGIYNTELITLYSAMKKPTYSDMQDYLIDSGNFQKLFGIDFMQPLTCNLQKLGHEMRSEDQYAFGVKNYRNGLEFCFTDVRAEEYIAMNLGCLAGPNGYLFPPFLAFEKNQQLADVNRIFGKDCLLLFTWTGSQTIMNFEYLAFGNVVNSFNANIFDENCDCHTALTPSAYSIQYIKYPCSDMEIYSSRIFNCSNFETVQFKDGNKRVRTPIKFVETGSKIKTPVCLFNNSVCFSKINDFTFSGSILFTYSGYEKIIRITGRHQLQNYTDMGMSNYLKPAFDPQEIDYISYPSSYSSIKACYSKNKNLFAPFLGEKMLDFFANLDGSIYFYDSLETLQYLNCVNRKLTPLPPFQAHCVANRIFNISGLPCLAGNNIIHFPLIQYFCVSELKESYYLSGVVEKTGSIPVSMTYVENDTFTNEKDLQGHWSISIGTGFSDLLEFDSIANAPQKINNNIYEIINNVDCFAYFKFSGLESGNPIYLNPVKYNYNANPFSGLICTNQYLHEEAFEERSGIYSGVNTLCLFAQITGDINICHKNCGSRTAFQKLSLNNSIFSGMQRVLKSHLESGTSRYPNFNLIPAGITESIRCSNEIAKTGSGYFLKIFDNSTRMIVDFTGIKVGNGDSFFNADGGIRCDYNFIQRNFFPYYSGKVTTGTDFRVLCRAFKVGDEMYQMQAEQKRYSALLIYQNEGFYFKHFRTFLPDSYDYSDEQCYRLFLTRYNWTGSFDRVYKTNGWPSFNCSFTEKCDGQLSYSELVENDRPSIESFSVHSYFTGFNQASGFDESPSINQYTEIYLCKTNDFGVKKNSLRHGLKNFCVGSLYSIQILNKTAPIFKIMSITENYINEYNIFATQYKEEKFLEIEENVQVDSLDNTFNALYYYQSASRLTQKNEPLKSPIILSIDYVRYSNTPALDIKWKPVSEHIVGYTQYRIYVQSPSKQTPNLQAIVSDEGYNRENDLFEYKYQGDGITNPLTNEVGNYTVSIEAFYEKDGVYVFSTPTKRSINVINY